MWAIRVRGRRGHSGVPIACGGTSDCIGHIWDVDDMRDILP